MSRAVPWSYADVLQVLADLPVIVRETRRRKGQSMRAAAKEAGVSFSTVCRIEAGEDANLSSVVALLKWVSR